MRKSFFNFCVLFFGLCLILVSCANRIDNEISSTPVLRMPVFNEDDLIPSFDSFEAIGVVHNSLLWDILNQNACPFLSMDRIEKNLLNDYYLSLIHDNFTRNYSDTVPEDFLQIAMSYHSLTGYECFYNNQLCMSYVDSVEVLVSNPLSYEVCYKLRELQRNFYNRVFVDDDSHLYYRDPNASNLMMVMLSVAANSAEFWIAEDTQTALNHYLCIDDEIPAQSIKWWKADMIGAVLGFAGGWISAIIWGGVSSIVAAIQAEIARNHSHYVSGYTIYEDPYMINEYRLYNVRFSTNPYSRY